MVAISNNGRFFITESAISKALSVMSLALLLFDYFDASPRQCMSHLTTHIFRKCLSQTCWTAQLMVGSVSN